MQILISGRSPEKLFSSKSKIQKVQKLTRRQKEMKKALYGLTQLKSLRKIKDPVAYQRSLRGTYEDYS